ncbi:hypothetical protein C0Q88_07440 [Ralstonia pickettii]|uniref:Uncharacterized protein n=1 Tax=Ralstonia pickettii TaxID=329 RepID=A0A2N4TXQ5_RALPI|nr:hypothetical protein [Ralstonia pickettii]PLC44504.1 hypothetical protein C0Q88_07440 [Ralstonia pickettii]
MPTVQEELDRKTFETLEWLFGAVRRGNLTQDQFSTGVDTLFMAVSGLLGKDFIDLITAAQAECSNEAPVLKRVFVNGKKILVIKWTVGSTRVTVGKRVNGLATGGHIKDFDSALDAKNTFEHLCHVVTSKGFEEI